MKPLFEIFDAENEKLLATQEVKKNLHKIDASDASVVVQLSSGDVKGNNFRALRPGDTELVVAVYSVNEKGNLAVLTGLGKEPVAVISTIFDIVKTCVTKNKAIETIVFRLNKRALKGKEKLLQRIIQKLVKARFGSRFEIKDEFIDVSPAMSFVVAQKSNAEELGDEFIEKQEKVKDKMVVKQLAIDFDNSESNASEIELLKKYGTPTKVAEKTYSLKVPGLDVEVLVDLNPGSKTKIVAINVDENQAKQIHKSGLEQYVSVKASEPGLTDVYSTKFDEYILSTIIHYAKGGKTHTVGNYDDDYDYPQDYAHKNGRPNHEYASKQGAYDAVIKAKPAKPANNLTIKDARKFALDEIKSYVEANNLKRETFFKYKYSNIIGGSSTHSNRQVLLGTTLPSGTTIAEYRDNKKCSGWIHNSSQVKPSDVAELALAIKRRLKKEGFNLSITKSGRDRYLEADDFVIAIAMAVPKTSDPFSISGNIGINMISAYIYNKATGKTYLLADDQSVSGEMTEAKSLFDIAKTILEQNMHEDAEFLKKTYR